MSNKPQSALPAPASRAARPESRIPSLSERAQALLHRQLDQGKPPAAIARGIAEQTGERVAPAAITRYGSGYRRQRLRQLQLRQRLDGVLAQVQRDGIQVSDLLRAVLVERLRNASQDGTAEQLDLLKLEEADRKREESEFRQRQAHFSNLCRERELDLKERKHALAEEHFQIQRERARANVAELERRAVAGKRLTPEDVARIREIYGLYENEADNHERQQA